MFPPSLHKNIRELDKQICLLETECENMETDKKKNRFGTKPSRAKANKLSSINSINSNLKSPPVKELSNKPFVTGPSRSSGCGNTRRMNKPLILPKMYSTSSVPSKEVHKSADRDRSPTRDVGLHVDRFINGQGNLHTCVSCTTNSRDRSPSSSRREKTLHGCISCCCSKKQSTLVHGNFKKDIEAHEDISKHQESENLILHREVVLTDPGSTIEVTVRRKSSSSDIGKVNELQCKHSIGLIKEVSETSSDRSDYNPCSRIGSKIDFKSTKESVSKLESKHQKWSEILCQESGSDASGKGKHNSKSDVKIQGVKSSCSLTSQDSTKSQCQQSKTFPQNQSKCADGESNNHPSNYSKENQKLNGQSSGKTWPSESRPSKSPKSLSKNRTTKSGPQIGLYTRVDEKEVAQNMYNPIRTLYYLMNELRGKSMDEELTKLVNDMRLVLQKIYSDNKKNVIHGSSLHSARNQKEENFDSFRDKDSDYILNLQTGYWDYQKLVDKMGKEKEKLNDELNAKNRVIMNMTNKEKEYLSLISSLKFNLKKAELQGEENMRIQQELNSVKSKSTDESKVIDALRKSHAKMQEHIQRCLLENDKLKTQIRMNKLEAQKFSVLLTGKDVEIKRYKEEVESFQKQISEQLAVLRSNAAVNEVEKAMEAIIHHSHIFSQTDLDSAASETLIGNHQKSSSNSTPTVSKGRHRLTHSSPTSTITSLADSSWNRISSIYAEEDNKKEVAVLSALRKPNLKDSFVTLSLQENSGYEAGSSKHSPESNHFLRDIQSAGDKKESSFTSCRSIVCNNSSEMLQEGEDTSKTTTHREVTKSFGTDVKESDECMAAIAANTQKLRENIEELFQDMKFRCTERIYSSPPENLKYDDIFGVSPVSDLSATSANLSELSSLKSTQKAP